MCLHLHDNFQIKKATKDIIVYKDSFFDQVLPQSFESLVKRYTYRLNKPNPKIKLRIKRHIEDTLLVRLVSSHAWVDKGYHSYVQFPHTPKGWPRKSVGVFKIPKGAVYIEGMVNGGPDEGYVSSKIIYLGPYTPEFEKYHKDLASKEVPKNSNSKNILSWLTGKLRGILSL